MAKINFYLKSTANSGGDNLILMSFYYSGERLRYSTGQTINPKLWNTDEQRARKNYRGQTSLNNYLNKLEDALNDIYLNALATKVNPTTNYLKQQLDYFLNLAAPKKDTKKTLIECYDEYFELCKVTMKYKTMMKYQTLKNHLKNFTTQTNYELSFENMNLTFYEKFLAYFIHRGLDNDSTYKIIQHFKTFLNWCLLKDYFYDIKFKMQWKIKSEQKIVQSLWENELWQLYEYKLTDNKVKAFYTSLDKQGRQYQIKHSIKVFETVHAMFLFGCFTGQRFSDIGNLVTATVQGNKINFNQIKTSGAVHGVLNDFAKEIGERYNYSFPRWTDQYVNRVLHELFEMAGLNREIKKVKYCGKTRTDISEPLYKAISFHWSRKSFATLSLSRGMRAETVMSQGGWRDVKAFRKYVAVSQNMIESEMQKAWSKPPSSPPAPKPILLKKVG